MKKLLTLALVLIMGIVILSGCDNFNNPVVPQSTDDNVMKCQSNSFSNNHFYIYEEDGIGYLIPNEIYQEEVDFSTYIKVNPQFKHYLLDIRDLVENGNIEFYNPEVSVAYLNKINVLIEMCDNSNLKAAENKLENDLIKYSNLWISNEEQKEGLNILFDLTLWMIQNPDEELYVQLSIIEVKEGVKYKDAMVNGIVTHYKICKYKEVSVFGISIYYHENCTGWITVTQEN